MKSAATATKNTILLDHANVVGTVVRGEWQQNRFYNTVADNTPSEDDEGYDIEFFPIDSITEPNRPKAGICKAMVGQAAVDSNYHDTVPSARYYTVDADDEYKYWQSPYSAGGSPFNITGCAPQVLYMQENGTTPLTVKANKVYFTVENTFASPTIYDVQIKTTTGGSWTTISSNVAVPAGGKVALWYNGTSWSTSPNYANSTNVAGVRLVVTRMNKQAYFNLIELGVSLELDLTPDVANWSDSFTMGEDDFITPLGTISSNSGSITLFNDAGTYTNSNPSSLLFGLLDKGAIMRGWMKYGSDLVQEFEMFSDNWEEGEDSTTVTIIDGAKFFMDTKPRPVLYQNIPVQEAIWRVCDIVGFNNYNVTAIDKAPHAIIDIFWTDGQKTAWEIFGELSRATQTAVYFDSYGVLQIKTRDAAWDDTKTSDYTFLRNSVPGGQPANIISLSEDSDYEANKVKVNWQPTGFSELVDNVVPMEVVWDADSSVVLRSTELAQNLAANGTQIVMPTNEGKTWPWSGMCQIEGEWISFDAKYYTYYNNTTRASAWVTSYEAQKRLDALAHPSYRHLNSYSGRLRVKERGLFNTEPAGHYIDMNGWIKGRQRNYGATNSPCSGIILNRASSTVTLTSPANSSMNDYTYLYRGNAVDQGYYYLGTRMKIDKTAHKTKIGGIFFNADTSLGAGYFLEVTATERMNGKVRNTRNEIMFYSMKDDGSKKVFGGEKVTLKDKSANHKKNAKTKVDIGAEYAVPMNSYLDIDLWYTPGTSDKVQVWVNGTLLFEAVIPAGWKHSRISRAGLFVRGHSSATFDYFYGINNLGVDPVDGESYFDRIDGAYRGNQLIKDWTYEERKVRRKIKKKWKKIALKYNQRFFEEFGPMVHEIREFKVKFKSETPVLQSKLFFHNTTQAVCTEYVGDIMGAHWIMANIDRNNAILNGDDDATTRGNGTVNQKMFVYGRPVIQKDTQSIEKSDEWSIRRRGVIDVEYNSNWIQNKSEADAFATWLTTHWSRSDSKVSVEVFGNPLIELGDVVTVNYKTINAKFYVIGISNSFDSGLTTNLTLRKAVDL